MPFAGEKNLLPPTSEMQMEGQVSMSVHADMVMLLSRISHWVDVEVGFGKVAQTVHELVLYLFGYLMSLLHRELIGDRQVNLSMELVSQPSQSDAGDLLYACNMSYGHFDLRGRPRVHSIDEAAEYGLGRAPDDAEDGAGDDGSDERICPRDAKPETEGAKEDRQAG
jgi:hypothetical protein